MIESLTEEIEAKAREYLERIDGMGGAVEAIESGWRKQEIEESAFRINQAVEAGERVVVGVNRFELDQEEPVELHALDPGLQQGQVDRLVEVRKERDQAEVDAALKELEEAARGSDNLLYPMKQALAEYATLGEVSDVLRGIFGEYEPRAL
jgi:methylmalonyl-CoA mutase, N-terminal domain